MNFPDMTDALDGFDQPISFACIGKAIKDFEVIENVKDILEFEGVLQPLPERKLVIKPEGQRSWKWWTLWAESKLEIDDVVRDEEGVQYRVMTQADWSRGGFWEYHLAQNPKIEQ